MQPTTPIGGGRFKLVLTTLRTHRRLILPVAVAVVFGAVGSYFLFQSKAATSTLNLEAETMVIPAGSQVISDGAARSGQAVKMLSNGELTGSVNLVAPVTSIAVRAKSDNCKGGAQFTLMIDNKQVLNSKAGGTWADYASAQSLAVGSHTVKVTYINDYYRRNCDRNLYVDVIAFTEQIPDQTPTPPTVAFTVPLNGSTVSGVVGVTANASDVRGIAGVQFKLDGANLGTEETIAPYEATWDTAQTANGSHTLTAVARNTAGLSTTASVSVTVANSTQVPPPNTSSSGSLGLLRIDPNEPIPTDLSKYRILLLDSFRWQQVAGLKSKYPSLKILAYKNLGFVCNYSNDSSGNSGVTWPQSQANPDWYLRNSSGTVQYSVQFGQCAFMDPMSGGYQQTWASNVIAYLKQAPWDGVFMDDTNADIGWHVNNNYGLLVKYPTRDAYKNAMRSLLAFTAGQVKAANYLAIPNIGASWDQPTVWADWATLSSGAMRENFLRWDGSPTAFTGADWKIHTDVQRAVEGVNRIFIALTYGSTTETNLERYVRASFLLFWQPANGSVGMWSASDGPDYSVELGLPKAAAVQSGNVWTRQFEHGSVSVDTAAGTATITKL